MAPNSQGNIHFNAMLSDGSRLTDPQHSHLLDTVRRMSIGLRTGPYATVTEPRVQVVMTNMIITWVLWMDVNGIPFFNKLTRNDFDAYAEKAPYGASHLLEFPERLKNYISNLRMSGTPPPATGRHLNHRQLLDDANIDWARARHDRLCCYELFKLAQEEGLYLYPRQLQFLRKGPPTHLRATQITVLRMLQPWEYQWQMRRILPGDRITFDPFPTTNIGRTSETLGMKVGRTKTIPVQQAMLMIDRSIRWVLDYSPNILGLISKADALATQKLKRNRLYRREVKKLSTQLQAPGGHVQPQLIFPTLISVSPEKLSIASARRCLFASCFVVIAAFTARRHGEITSCRAKGPNNELCTSVDRDGCWIEMWIEKTVRGWDKTPCPEVVMRAVDCLRQLSENARSISGNPDLFQYKLFGTSKTATFRVVKALRELSEHLDIPSMSDGTTWKFRAHQFRRFYAIMYVWRYEFGDLSALSYQLRHYNLEMTVRYVTEPTQGKIFREVQTQHSVSILKEVALGRRQAGGPFGERFKKVAQRIRAQMISSVHVFSEGRFANQIERLILRSGKLLKGFPWGYCTCGCSQRDLSQAKCLQGTNKTGTGPNETRATLKTCANCPHHLTHEVFRPYVSNQIELHKKASTDRNNGALVRNASAAYLSDLEEYYDRSFSSSQNARFPNAADPKHAGPEDCHSKPTGRSGKNKREDHGTPRVRKKGNAKRSVRAKVARTVPRLD